MPHSPAPPTFRVTILLVAVFLLGGWQLWQGVLYWQQFDVLEQYSPVVNLRILAIFALMWGGLFVGTAVFHFLKPNPTIRHLPLSLLLFFGYTIAIQALFNQNSMGLTRWAALTAVTLLAPALTHILLKPPHVTRDT